MTKVHRDLMKRLSEVRAVNLDTAYGFQENVPQMTEKLLEYFSTSLHTAFEALHFTSFEHSSDLERTIFKQKVRGASYVFAGPGSPSYALAQWQPLGLTDDLIQVLDDGGTVCFSSAAAVTIGAFTAPIYEIYKVGAAPHWLNGLNLTAHLGLNCVVIPHFDNKEGGNYDTGCCYLGLRRLTLMEHELPEGVATLGVDEHTALIIDLAKDTLAVRGKGHGYWRLGGDVRVIENATVIALDELRSIEPPTRADGPTSVATSDTNTPADLGRLATQGGEQALQAIAQLVQLASTGGEGFIDPSALIEGILAARRKAREENQYGLADELRDALVRAGVEVNDTPDGVTWSLRTS